MYEKFECIITIGVLAFLLSSSIADLVVPIHQPQQTFQQSSTSYCIYLSLNHPGWLRLNLQRCRQSESAKKPNNRQ